MAAERAIAELELFLAERGEPLLRTAVLLTGSREAGEDLLQAALERLLRHWRRMEGDPEGYRVSLAILSGAGSGVGISDAHICDPVLDRVSFIELGIAFRGGDGRQFRWWRERRADVVRVCPGPRRRRRGHRGSPVRAGGGGAGGVVRGPGPGDDRRAAERPLESGGRTGAGGGAGRGGQGAAGAGVDGAAPPRLGRCPAGGCVCE
jgi:hypothetical protein